MYIIGTQLSVGVNQMQIMTLAELVGWVQLARNDPNAMALAVNGTTDDERVIIRNQLECLKIPAPRNLYFNYETQKWIVGVTNNEGSN